MNIIIGLLVARLRMIRMIIIIIVTIRSRNGRIINALKKTMKKTMLRTQSTKPRMIASYSSCSRNCIIALRRWLAPTSADSATTQCFQRWPAPTSA